MFFLITNLFFLLFSSFSLEGNLDEAPLRLNAFITDHMCGSKGELYIRKKCEVWSVESEERRAKHEE